jgi:hypothetical protein
MLGFPGFSQLPQQLRVERVHAESFLAPDKALTPTNAHLSFAHSTFSNCQRTSGPAQSRDLGTQTLDSTPILSWNSALSRFSETINDDYRFSETPNASGTVHPARLLSSFLPGCGLAGNGAFISRRRPFGRHQRRNGTGIGWI